MVRPARPKKSARASTRPVAKAVVQSAKTVTPGTKAGSKERRSQQERTESAKRELLAAALELVAERGYRGASLAAIGERAGYSRGLVTEHFGSKEGLLRELVSRLMSRWRGLVVSDSVGALSGAKAVTAVVHAHRRAIAEGPATMRALYVLLFESVLDSSAVRDEFRTMDARIRELAEAYLVRGQAEGTVRKDVDARAQATLALAVVRGVTLQWMVDPEALDLDRTYAELARWIERGVGTEVGEDAPAPPRRARKKA